MRQRRRPTTPAVIDDHLPTCYAFARRARPVQTGRSLVVGGDMPRAPRVCNQRGCTQGTHDPSGKCETHRLEQRRDADQRRPGARQRGYDKTWQRTRASYLAAHPWCECGCGKRSTDVDHIDGLGPNGPRGHDDTNLQALSHACHSRITAEHDGAFGRPKAPRGGTAAP